MPSVGPRNGGTFVNDTSIGDTPWVNPSNAQNDDNVVATCDLGYIPEFNQVKLVKNGTITGNDNGTGSLTTNYVYYTFGGKNDLWGLTWTKADIENTNFGVAIFISDELGLTFSNYLKITNFGFTLSENSIINGIEVVIKCKYESITFDVQVDYVSIKVYHDDNQCWARVIDLLDTWIKKHK